MYTHTHTHTGVWRKFRITVPGERPDLDQLVALRMVDKQGTVRYEIGHFRTHEGRGAWIWHPSNDLHAADVLELQRKYKIDWYPLPAE